MRPTGLTVSAVGDLMFDTRLPRVRVLYRRGAGLGTSPESSGGPAQPWPNTAATRRWAARRGLSFFDVAAGAHASSCVPLPARQARAAPLAALTALLRSADVALGNLEAPLSRRGRAQWNDMAYRAHPRFAGHLAAAGLRVVSLANNHAFDFGETALLDTLRALRRERVRALGAGPSEASARRALLLRRRGRRLALVARSMVGAPSVFAVGREAGVAALDGLTVDDVRRLRARADHVLLSLHWGQENAAMPHPAQVDLAHALIDAGADAIFGHHPHVPGPIEIYRGRPIFYSLGNCVFGHHHAHWEANLLGSLRFTAPRRPPQVSVTPLSTGWRAEVLRERDAARAVATLAERSRCFGTRFVAAGLATRVEGAR